MAEFPSTADSYQLCHPVGKGSTANVWHAKCVPLNKEVAIKIIDLENCPSNLEEIRVRSVDQPPHYPALTMILNFTERDSTYEIVQSP